MIVGISYHQTLRTDGVRIDDIRHPTWKHDRLSIELPAAIENYTASKINACMLSTDIIYYYVQERI